MKLSKFQIIILVVLFFIWKNQNGGGIDGPNYIADIARLNQEAKVVSGLNILLSDIQPSEYENQYSESKSTAPKVLKERLVLLTDSVSCAPCIQFERSVLEFLRNDENKALGWRLGERSDDHIQIVDISKNQELFEYYVTVLSVNGIYDIATPMLFKITNENKIDPQAVSYGSITADEFLDYYQEFFYNRL